LIIGVVTLARPPDYKDMMRRPVEAAIDQRLEERYGKFESKSTFKKPYGSDDYLEMEHFYYKYPDYEWTWPPRYPTEDEDEYEDYPGGGSECDHCIITCYDSGANSDCDEDNAYGSCHVSIACCADTPNLSNCQQQYKWEIYGPPARVEHFKNAIGTGDVSSGGSAIKIYPDWSQISVADDKKEAEYTVVLTDGLGNKCRANVKIKCKEECCPADTTFEYDPDNAETMGQSDEITITVLGGCPPFDWSVSGSGFSFAQSETDTRFNTLIADAGSCGSATITVTDDCGDTVTGYVRNTTGSWVYKSTGCSLSGTGTYTGESGSNVYYELISGNKKQVQTSNRFMSGTANCPWVCTTPGGCNDLCDDTGAGRSCANCIDPCTYTEARCNQGFACDCSTESTYACWANIFGSMAYYEWEC